MANINRRIRSSACPVNTRVDPSRPIRPDLRAGAAWLIKLGCADGYDGTDLGPGDYEASRLTP
jgi:hypothetical protein